MKKRVAIIGAGVAGLVTAKSLREEGIEPVVFEKGHRLGGLWFFDRTSKDGGGPAYRSLRTNVSRHTMGFSDFPMPESFDDFPTRDQVLRYLEDYAAEFDLAPHLNFDCSVQAIAPDGDGWRVDRERGSERFDGVVICSGRHQTPFEPSIPGADAFVGTWMHSRDYVEPSPFAGKRVLVIGAGSSGADIAVELAGVAEQTYISSEHGAWFIPKRLTSGKPADHVMTRLSSYVPLAVRNRVFRRLVARTYRDRGLDVKKLSLPLPEFDMKRARITPCDEIVEALADGRVHGMPGIDHVESNAVVFKGGRRVEMDTVVLATGYRTEYPFLPEGIVGRCGRVPRLFRHVFPPRQPGLAFVGTPWVVGPYPPVFELQARWVAQVFAGARRLPADDEMERCIEAAVRASERAGVRFDREQFVEYMDELAGEIGCRPHAWRHPGLAKLLLVGPLVAAQYRLEGPGKSERAAAVLRETQGRA